MQNLVPHRANSHHISEWPVELSSFDDRDVRWCFNYFSSNQSPQISTFDKEVSIINFFKNNMNSINQITVDGYMFSLSYDLIHSLKHSNVIDLSWIDKNDLRLIIWLSRRGLAGIKYDILQSSVLCARPISIYGCGIYMNILCISSSHESMYSFVIEYIDSIRIYSKDAVHKQVLVDQLRKDWLNARTPEKDTDWIDPHNEQQLRWAWQYLLEHHKSVQGLNPITKSELHQSILASLDLMGSPSFASQANFERKYFLVNFRKAWSQKKYRASGKTKKQYHLPLTKKTKSALQTLSQVTNSNESEVLERLINQEYVENFLDSTGKEKY